MRRPDLKHTYSGHAVPRGVPQCIYEGWTDRGIYGLPLEEALYTGPWFKRTGWRLGWGLAAVLLPAPRPTKPTEPPRT